MRFQSITIRDLGPFKSFSCDLTQFPDDAKLVAITGPNGSGKSTLLELLTGGALYRECRTRGTLTSLATSRNASLEVRLENGQPWTIRHTVDNVSAKGESIALDANGEPVTTSGKLKEYDTWSSSHMPSPELLYGSQVLAQGSGGFLDLKPGDRKALILRLLGVERLEPMAKAARDFARDEQVKLSGLQSQADALLKARTVDAVELELVTCRVHCAGATEARERAQSNLDVARELAKDSALAWARYREQRMAWDDLARELAKSASAIKATVDKLSAIDLGALRSAVMVADASLAESKRQLEAARMEETRSQEKRVEAERVARERKRLTEELAVCSRDASGIEAKIRNNRSVLDSAEEIRAFVTKREKAAKDLPKAQDAERAARANLETAQNALELISNERLAGADFRIVCLRSGLERIAGVVESPTAVARDTLSRDDRTVNENQSLPQRKRDAEVLVAVRRNELDQAVGITTLLSGQACERHPHEEQLTKAETRIAELQLLFDAEVAKRVALSAHLAALPKPEPIPVPIDLDALSVAVDEAQRSLDARRAAVTKAESDIGHMSIELARLRTVESDLRARLDAMMEPAPPDTRTDLTPLEDALRDAKADEVEATKAIGRAEAALKQAKADAARLEELTRELDMSRAELADWARLGEDLGRDGLQASLIDSACARLTVLANDLLHSCVGSRWTVSLDTQRASADGKRQLEGFEVRVLDSEAGRDTTAETLSGGERVLVGEAISLALTTLACQRAGIERPTLVRDETGAALDADKTRSYVAMLRRAVEQIGAHMCLFVSHSLEVQEMADARIEL